MNIVETNIIECNYSDPDHLEAIAKLLNIYIADAMGGGEPLSKIKQLRLIDGLNEHPTAIVLLAEYDGTFCGMLVSFLNFSTFSVSPMINIHDIIVDPEFRNKGIGRKLMEAIIEKGEDLSCSRITLEVRKDNLVAQNLYKSMGFGETDPEMLYWRKYL